MLLATKSKNKILLNYALICLILLVCEGCAGQSNGDLRLNNDKPVLLSNISEGRLEVYLNSEWGTVCDDNFMYNEATVACRQLGYSGVISYDVAGRLGFRNGDDAVLIHLDQVNCTGKEDALHLMSCITNAHGEHDCLHTEDIALKCSETLLSNDDPFDGQVRVSGGTYPSEGRVEVYCNEEWGTICDDYFNVTEANTICLQLGYTHAEKFDHLNNLAGNESQSIWLDNVQCGTTSRQCISFCQRCPNKEFHNCAHHEDVTIKCSFNLRMANINDDVGLASCKINYSSSISGEVIAVIVVLIVFASVCFSLCSVSIAFAVCWIKAKSVTNDDSISNATEMTRSTVSSQPVPPPRPSDLPPLLTPPTSAFSPTFSPFSPFDGSLPLPPPRPQNLGKLTTPTKPINPLFSPFPMQSIYESTPVYIAPGGNTGRPIYIEPTKMDDEELPPPYPNCVNHYERTPTGMLPLLVNQDKATVLYESIPPLLVNENVACEKNEQLQCNEGDEEGDYEKLHNQSAARKGCCYDNLQPRTDEAEPSAAMLPDSAVTISSTKDTVSYINIKEVQETEAPSYDLLEPASELKASDKPAGIDEGVEAGCSNTMKRSKEEAEPCYENTRSKNIEMYSSINKADEKKRCNSMSW